MVWLWMLWTHRADTTATVGNTPFLYVALTMSSQLVRCSVELKGFGASWRVWGGPLIWLHVRFPGTSLASLRDELSLCQPPASGHVYGSMYRSVDC